MAQNVREAVRKASLQAQNFIYEASDALVTFVDEVIEVVEDVVEEASAYLEEKVEDVRSTVEDSTDENEYQDLFNDLVTKFFGEAEGTEDSKDEPVAEPGGSTEVSDEDFYKTLYKQLLKGNTSFQYYPDEEEAFVKAKGDGLEFDFLWRYSPNLFNAHKETVPFDSTSVYFDREDYATRVSPLKVD